MTRKIFFSVFLSFIITKVAIADPSLPVKIPEPLGPLVSIKTIDENNKTVEKRAYDNKGNLLKLTVFDETGAVSEEDEYAYYSNNTKSKHLIKDQAFTGGVIIRYGKNGEVLEVADSRQGNWVGNAPFTKWINKYSPAGILTEKLGVYQNGEVFQKTSYIYKDNFLAGEKTTKKGKSGQYQIKYERDPKGNAKKVTKTDFDGTLSNVETFQYDAQGHKIEWVENAYYHGAPRGKTILRFDEHGNRIERINVSEFGTVLEKRIYTYDNKDNLISEDIGDGFGNHSGTYKYKYDDKGNLAEQATYFRNNLDSKLIYQYEYDSYGNWTKKVEVNWDFQNNEFVTGSVLTRIIQYRK